MLQKNVYFIEPRERPEIYRRGEPSVDLEGKQDAVAHSALNIEWAAAAYGRSDALGSRADFGEVGDQALAIAA